MTFHRGLRSATATLAIVTIVADCCLSPLPQPPKSGPSTPPKFSPPSITASLFSSASNGRAAIGPNCPATTAASPRSARSRCSTPACRPTIRPSSKRSTISAARARQDLHRRAANHGPLRRRAQEGHAPHHAQREVARSAPNQRGRPRRRLVLPRSRRRQQQLPVRRARPLRWPARRRRSQPRNLGTRRQLTGETRKTKTAPGAMCPATPAPAA